MQQVNGTATAANSLDSADYDPLEHLNAIFSHPSTLSSVSAVSSAIRQYEYGLDKDIAALVTAQSASAADSVNKMQTAKEELANLFKKIDDIKERALHTEQAITEMTADIKRLDNTKRNLTLSMTALKRLQMLTTAYERLSVLSKSRQYRECAQLLQAVIQLMAHFKSYRSIDQIATLSRNVADLQRRLLEQVCEDFEVTFAQDEVAQRKGMLTEACLVMDSLGENARARLITWYCNTQLREYRQVFRGNDEAGSLDNISRRYSWFNRLLKTYDTEHASIFPAHWRVNEMLANAFCEGTREDYKNILQKLSRRADGQSLDVNLLLSCLQETLDFEHSLERRFYNASRASLDSITSSRDEKPHAFSQAISEAFEPYLSVWVESQDKQLSVMIPKYRQQGLRNPDEDHSAQTVVPSSIELFNFYRLTLAQCAKLSTGGKLLQLSQTFAKYLDQYGQQVLYYFLGEKTGGPSTEDAVLILNTADYCYTTCGQLEEKIKSRIDEDLKDRVDLQSQADAFMGIASAAIRILVRRVELECEPSWREMRNMSWSKLESVGDQSVYVSGLVIKIHSKGTEILKLLDKQQYARAFCDHLVDAIVNVFALNIVQCRPISEVGAEQLLLDSYALKKGFTELLKVRGESGAGPHAGFVKRVNQSMGKIDQLLKTLQVRSSPPEGLVQAYLIHIGDMSDTNFRKILELKGIRRQDQPHLVELFHAHRASQENLVQSSPLLTALQVSASNIGTGMGPLGNVGSISTPTLTGARFDPSSLGSALMSVARDGVDKFGNPVLGQSAMSSRAASPPQGADGHGANLNDNLRNIGKFFRRDVTGFGRFGRAAEEGRQ